MCLLNDRPISRGKTNKQTPRGVSRNDGYKCMYTYCAIVGEEVRACTLFVYQPVDGHFVNDSLNLHHAGVGIRDTVSFKLCCLNSHGNCCRRTELSNKLSDIQISLKNIVKNLHDISLHS